MAQGYSGYNVLSNAVRFGDSGSIDAFNRLRVSNPTGLFSTQTQYDLDPLVMEGGATGTGSAPSHSSDTRMAALTVAAGTGTSFFQSYQYWPYQPGKSQLVEATFVLGAGVAAATVDIGYFDAANGIFLRQNGASGLQWVRRTSTSGGVVNDAIDQADWNLDTLDGNGPSGITVDETKSQILVIDLQFLSMGRVRVGFDIGGEYVYAHEFNSANSLAVPYMQTATLPVQALVTATATAGDKTAHFKCATVISEGGFASEAGYAFSTGEAVVTAGNGTRTGILDLRPLATFASKTNRSMVLLDSVTIGNSGTRLVFWELCIGVTYSVAPTWANVNTTYSGCEWGYGGTYSALAGLVLASGYVAGSGASSQAASREIPLRYPITLDRAGSQRSMGTLSLLAYGIGATNAIRATFNFREIR